VAVIHLGDKHRTTQAETVIVAPLFRPQQASVSVIGKRIPGVQEFVDEVVVPAA